MSKNETKPEKEIPLPSSNSSSSSGRSESSLLKFGKASAIEVKNFVGKIWGYISNMEIFHSRFSINGAMLCLLFLLAGVAFRDGDTVPAVTNSILFLMGLRLRSVMKKRDHEVDKKLGKAQDDDNIRTIV